MLLAPWWLNRMRWLRLPVPTKEPKAQGGRTETPNPSSLRAALSAFASPMASEWLELVVGRRVAVQLQSDMTDTAVANLDAMWAVVHGLSPVSRMASLVCLLSGSYTL